MKRWALVDDRQTSEDEMTSEVEAYDCSLSNNGFRGFLEKLIWSSGKDSIRIPLDPSSLVTSLFLSISVSAPRSQ